MIYLMGNLLRALSRLDGSGDWCVASGEQQQPGADVFVDFEDARPENEADRGVYHEAEEVIRRAEDVLDALRQYKGAASLYLSLFSI